MFGFENIAMFARRGNKPAANMFDWESLGERR